MATPRAGFDTGGGARVDTDALSTRLNDQPSARSLRVSEPGFGSGLLRANRASITAEAADFSLLAADYVAWHRRAVPTERCQAALQNMLASGDAIVFQVHR